MIFPNDIKLAMRDCILKLFWPKSDIVNFFKNNGCTTHDLKCIENFRDMHRNEIIDNLFSFLDSKPDEGLAQYRSMMQSLINWSQFDSYYFENLQKLNRKDAESAISHLKQLQEIRDARIKEQRNEREKKHQQAMQASTTLNELKKSFFELMQGQLSAQKRGYEFEKLLQELSKLSLLEVTEPFRVNGEQIDGAVKFEGEHYIIEAKWQEKESSNESLYQFAHKAEGKMYGRGLFISINGFSEYVIKSLVDGKAIKTILIDGFDITIVLEGFISFSGMLDAKIKAAQAGGLIYIDPLTGKSKVKN